jgi:hypothetical protein
MLETLWNVNKYDFPELEIEFSGTPDWYYRDRAAQKRRRGSYQRLCSFVVLARFL